MEVRNAIKDRRSIRQFLSKPVPDELLNEIMSDSLWAPSWGNTQPWEIVVATGEVLKKFKEESAAALNNGLAFNTDIPIPEVWPDTMKKRYKGIGRSVLDSQAIAREDVEGRNRYYQQMFSMFNAPVLVMFMLDQDVSLEYAMLDVGSIMQTFCLLAADQGLGTCIMATSINYAKMAHKLLNIPDRKQLVVGVALGWPDTG
ncbi:MAG: nitroreductase, partial [Deltaproteobacteria bacterium]|nr:nitroreductase [Deltaproteobacteria bacterium]